MCGAWRSRRADNPAPPHAAKALLRDIHPDELTPRGALDLVCPPKALIAE
jgi:hypothetical protein